MTANAEQPATIAPKALAAIEDARFDSIREDAERSADSETREALAVHNILRHCRRLSSPRERA